MEIKNEICKYLNISNLFLELPTSVTVIVIPEKINEDVLTINSSVHLENKGILKIELKTGELYSIACDIQKVIEKNNNYNCYFLCSLPESIKIQINQLNNISEIRNKRTEIRYDVGINKWEDFGLTHPECLFFNKNMPVKCLISNASVHGLLLIGQRSSIKIGEMAIFSCASKEGPIKIQAVLVKSNNLTTTYFSYGFRLLEPLPINWLKLIKDYSRSNDFETQS